MAKNEIFSSLDGSKFEIFRFMKVIYLKGKLRTCIIQIRKEIFGCYAPQASNIFLMFDGKKICSFFSLKNYSTSFERSKLRHIFFLVSITCGQTSNENCTYLMLNNQRNADMANNCNYKICPVHDTVSRIRLDLQVT